MIREGDKAPAFSGVTGEGQKLSLADFQGKPLVMFFYPKDDTTVCTKEACSFRDNAGEIRAMGGEVLGISNDGASSHQKFVAKHRLNYPLISDEGGEIGKAFGIARLGGFLAGWIPPRRVTFVIDGSGVVRRVLESEFDASKHVDGALQALREIAGRTA